MEKSPFFWSFWVAWYFVEFNYYGKACICLKSLQFSA